jgi:hypothetical protein
MMEVFHVEPKGRYRWAPLVRYCYGVRLLARWYPTREKALAYIPQAGEQVCGFARVN